MPYSNQRRHNAPCIPQTRYQTLFISCPNFDPIYQVNLLENPNECNLSPVKEESWQKERERERSKDWKEKEVKPQLKSSMFFEKKERMKFTSYWERLYQKKERKEIAIYYSAKSDLWPHPYPHIICICTTFYSFTFPFLTPIHYTILHQPRLFATQTL
jgi:hypothetical protein